MFKQFINEITRICTIHPKDEILSNVCKLYNHYNSNTIRHMVNNEIYNNFDMNKLQIIRNNDNAYYKYNILNTSFFDIYDIKWEKGCHSKIHDHPENGCIMYMYNNGSITEFNFSNQNDLIQTGKKNLHESNICYKVGDRYLHKIHANKYSETLHIYIPGNYVTKYYTNKNGITYKYINI